MTYAYEPSDFNELTVFLRWRGTFMPMVLCRPALWMLLASHVFFLYLRLYRPEIYLCAPRTRDRPGTHTVSHAAHTRMRRRATATAHATCKQPHLPTCSRAHRPPMPWKLILVPTSLLTFFLVFYSGNCFQRYYNCAHACNTCGTFLRP